MKRWLRGAGEWALWVAVRDELRKELAPGQLHQLAWILVAAFLIALDVHWLIRPAGLTSGGATGVGILLNNLWGWDVTLINAAITIVGVALEFWLLGVRPGFRSVFGTVSFLIALKVLTPLYDVPLTLNPLLALVPAAVLAGVGLGLVAGNHATTGGSGGYARVLAKYHGKLTYWGYSFLIDVVVVSLLGLVRGPLAAAVGLVLTCLIWMLVDVVAPFVQGYTPYLLAVKGKAVLSALEAREKRLGRGEVRGTSWYVAIAFQGRMGLPLVVWVPPAEVRSFWGLVKSMDTSARVLVGNKRLLPPVVEVLTGERRTGSLYREAKRYGDQAGIDGN